MHLIFRVNSRIISSLIRGNDISWSRCGADAFPDAVHALLLCVPAAGLEFKSWSCLPRRQNLMLDLLGLVFVVFMYLVPTVCTLVAAVLMAVKLVDIWRERRRRSSSAGSSSSGPISGASLGLSGAGGAYASAGGAQRAGPGAATGRGLSLQQRTCEDTVSVLEEQYRRFSFPVRPAATCSLQLQPVLKVLTYSRTSTLLYLTC